MSATTEALGMQMAKANEADMLALLDVVNIIEQMAKGWMPTIDEGNGKPADDGTTDDDSFDLGNPDHCRRVIAMLLRAEARGGLLRAAFGLTVLLHPKNELVDPDADHIKKHPKIVRALAAQDENDAAGARNRFLMQLLLDNGVLHQDGQGTWALRGIRSDYEGGPRGIGSSPEQAIDGAITATKALKGG